MNYFNLNVTSQRPVAFKGSGRPLLYTGSGQISVSFIHPANPANIKLTVFTCLTLQDTSRYNLTLRCSDSSSVPHFDPCSISVSCKLPTLETALPKEGFTSRPYLRHRSYPCLFQSLVVPLIVLSRDTVT